jgi:hypothetical protein
MAWRNIEINQLISMHSLLHIESAQALDDDRTTSVDARVSADHSMDAPIADGAASSVDLRQDSVRRAGMRLSNRLVRKLMPGSWAKTS